MKTRFFQAEMKEIELKEWSIKIKWFASTPDIDRYNDIVNPKAFKWAIDWYMENPVILLQHNSDKPIWKTIDYKIGKKGLNIEVELTNDIDNVFKNIQDWILKGFSIWFIPKKWEYKIIDNKEIREITEIDLIEVSVVSTPANASSLFTLSKSIKSFFEEIKEDEFINNNNIMDAKEILDTAIEIVAQRKETEDCEVEEIETVEEVQEEEKGVIWEDWVIETDDEIVEGTNTIPDEVESADESSATETETETETSENDEEVEEEVAEDEAGDVEKDIATMKQELAEHKELLDTLLDNLIALSNKTQEVKWYVESLPIKRWLATIGQEKQIEDPLVKALKNAREQF